MDLLENHHPIAVLTILFFLHPLSPNANLMLHKTTIVLLLYYVGGPLFFVAFLLACVLFCTRTRCMSYKIPSPPRLQTSAPIPANELSTLSDYYYMPLSHIYRPMAFSTPSPLYQMAYQQPQQQQQQQQQQQPQQQQQQQSFSHSGPSFRQPPSPPLQPPPPPYDSHVQFTTHPNHSSAVTTRTLSTFRNEELPSYEEATFGSSPPSFEVACAMQRALSHLTCKFS